MNMKTDERTMNRILGATCSTESPLWGHIPNNTVNVILKNKTEGLINGREENKLNHNNYTLEPWHLEEDWLRGSGGIVGWLYLTFLIFISIFILYHKFK